MLSIFTEGVYALQVVKSPSLICVTTICRGSYNPTSIFSVYFNALGIQSKTVNRRGLLALIKARGTRQQS